MTIRLDLSFLSGDLRSIIVNSEEIKSFSIDRSADVDYTITTGRTTSTVADQHDPKTIITLDYKKESLEDFKVILRDILARNHLDNFTIAEDIEAENTVAILRDGDLNNSEYMFASIVERPLRVLMKESFMKEYTILCDSVVHYPISCTTLKNLKLSCTKYLVNMLWYRQIKSAGFMLSTRLA